MTRRRAVFSECRKWRYILYIVWDASLPLLHFCMLNPSKADEFVNDPTVERQCRRAAMMGCGGLIVTNAYAWRDTYPEGLYVQADPIGEFNNYAILKAAKQAKRTIIGWGTHCDKVCAGRADYIVEMLANENIQVHALAINANGSPKHPLYCGYDAELIPYP